MERKLNGKLVDDFGYPVLSFFLTIGNPQLRNWYIFMDTHTHTYTHACARARTHARI